MDPQKKCGKKSRVRVPTVCTVCRRRKMKCDKGKPHCSSCVRNGTTHLCHYEEQPWASDNELQRLKEQVFQLQEQNVELKRLLNERALDEAAPVGDSTGFIIPDQPASDPFLELAENFDLMLLKESKISHYGSTSYMSIVAQDPILRQVFQKFLDVKAMGIDFGKYFLYDQGFIPMRNDECSITSNNPMTSIFEQVTGSQEELVQSISNVLPPRNILNALIDHFFAETYAFVPYLDEESFRKNNESLISSTPEGKTVLVLNNASQFVTIATLLCVLRFSFLSLPVQTPQNAHNELIQTILRSGVQVPPTYIEYAKACVANAAIFRRPSLKHIQALLLLRLYRFYAPEDGDESSDSTMFLALLVQMAKMHGLHRDPSRFGMVQDHATALLWRKIWLGLLHLDAMQSLQFGCPLLIDDEYDTELPVPSSLDSAMEKSCIEAFVKLNEVTQLMRSMIKAASKIKTHPKRSELDTCLRKLEHTISKYRSIEDLTDLKSPAETFLSKTNKVKELILKLQLYNLHSVFAFILMLTCDGGELSSFQRYAASTAESTFIIFRFYHYYARDPACYNSALNFEAFLSASVFESAKRCSQQAASLCLRDLAGMFNISRVLNGFNFEDSKGLKQWLTPLCPEFTHADHMLILIEQSVKYCSLLSPRYFVCWRLVFVHNLFQTFLETHYPNKFQDLDAAIKRYNASSIDGKSIDLDIPSLTNDTKLFFGVNKEASDLWQQLLQDATDYMDSKVYKFDSITDPFLKGSVFDPESPVTLQDFDNAMNFNTNDSTYRAESSKDMTHRSYSSSINTNDSTYRVESSRDMTHRSYSSSNNTNGETTPPSSTESGISEGQLNNMKFMSTDVAQEMVSNGADPLGASETMPTDEDLAIQIAHSMFGTSNGTGF